MSTPSTPVLLAPMNGGAVSSGGTVILFAWNSVPNATSYRLQVASDVAFSRMIYDGVVPQSPYPQTGGSVNRSLFAPRVTCYWRVSASNADGTSAWSAVWNFLSPDVLPSAPVLTGPSNGAIGVSRTTQLNWSPSQYVNYYTVQVATDSSFSNVVVNRTGLQTPYYLEMPELAADTRYYWRVNATNNAGTSTWSTVWNFLTGNPPPGIPVLTSPSNGASRVSPSIILGWQWPVNTERFVYQLATDSGFANVVASGTVYTDTSPSIPLQYGTKYYWRVYAAGSGGYSPWSAAWSFNILAQAGTPPGGGGLEPL